MTLRRRRPRALGLGACLLALVAPLGGGGCGDEEQAVSMQRGVPGGSRAKASKAAAVAPIAPVDESERDDLPARPSPKLDSTSFARRRDPFNGSTYSEPMQPSAPSVRAERRVVLQQYAFEELLLVTILSSRSGRIRPQAMFVANDGFSGSVKQGQHFSRAEVLLVAVNQDYVEVEVVDEELAASLGMQRGERRALYLRNE